MFLNVEQCCKFDAKLFLFVANIEETIVVRYYYDVLITKALILRTTISFNIIMNVKFIFYFATYAVSTFG